MDGDAAASNATPNNAWLAVRFSDANMALECSTLEVVSALSRGSPTRPTADQSSWSPIHVLQGFHHPAGPWILGPRPENSAIREPSGGMATSPNRSRTK